MELRETIARRIATAEGVDPDAEATIKGQAKGHGTPEWAQRLSLVDDILSDAAKQHEEDLTGRAADATKRADDADKRIEELEGEVREAHAAATANQKRADDAEALSRQEAERCGRYVRQLREAKIEPADV